MQAIRYDAFGDYGQNRLIDLPPPVAVDDQVLLRMNVVGINPLDNTFRSGHHSASTPANLPRIGGQSGVGTVIGGRHPDFRLGARVIVGGGPFGRTLDGTWREVMAVDARFLFPVLETADDVTAAAFVAGAGYMTGYLSLTEFARFKQGQTVLAPGIGGAVGMESVQIARRLGASMAISTSSTTAKAEQARAAGYEHVIDLSREGLRDGVMRLTGGKGVDVVIDGVGGPVTGEAIGSLAFGGMLVSVGYAGSRMTQVDVTDLIWRGATVRGFMFHPQLLSPTVITAAQRKCTEFLAEGSLTPTVARVFPLGDAAEAVRYLIEDRPFGRVLLQVPPDPEPN